MESMVKKEYVQIVDKVDNWMEAINKNMEPLLKDKCIEKSYVQAIFDNTEKYGPYYVIAPKIALPHASPESGVLSKAISVLLIKEAVKFSNDGHDVHLVIGLAPTDYQTHLNALVKLSEMLDDASQLSKILQASSTEELYEFFKKI